MIKLRYKISSIVRQSDRAKIQSKHNKQNEIFEYRKNGKTEHRRKKQARIWLCLFLGSCGHKSIIHSHKNNERSHTHRRTSWKWKKRQNVVLAIWVILSLLLYLSAFLSFQTASHFCTLALSLCWSNLFYQFFPGFYLFLSSTFLDFIMTIEFEIDDIL